MEQNETSYRIAQLIMKRLRNELTEVERQELLGWQTNPEYKELFEEFSEEKNILSELNEFDGRKQRIRSKINIVVGDVTPVHRINETGIRNLWKRFSVAASVILLLGVGTYFLFFNGKTKENKVASQQNIKNDVAPGKFRAKLTIDNGSTVILDSTRKGEITRQGGTIVENRNGQLVYNGQSINTQESATNQQPIFNTLTTGRGEVYSTILSDGSKVWLNSASSIKFPVAFIGNERKVEVTGEAYFEVAKNSAMPFKVNVAGKQEVQVLGTHFNINAYTDEVSINTTLLEGRVKLTSLITNQSSIMTPGQQAQQSINGTISFMNDVDEEEVLAWKNGIFHFESADLKTILRQFARWYDVEVIYEGQVSDEKYLCIVSRNTSLLNVLKSLQANAIQFRIEGKKLFIK